MNTAPVFCKQIFQSQRIRQLIGIKSVSLISDDKQHSLVMIAAATDMNQPARIQGIAVQHGVIQCFLKRKSNKILFSCDTARSNDQSHEPVHDRRNHGDFSPYPSVNLKRSANETSPKRCLQRFETADPDHYDLPKYRSSPTDNSTSFCRSVRSKSS